MTVSEALVLGPGKGRQFIARTVKVESGTADFFVFEGRPAPGWLQLRLISITATVRPFTSSKAALISSRACGASVWKGGLRPDPAWSCAHFANPGPAKAQVFVIGSPPVQKMVEELGLLFAEGDPQPETIAQVRSFDSELVE